MAEFRGVVSHGITICGQDFQDLTEFQAGCIFAGNLESTGDLDLTRDLARRLKAARALSGKKVRDVAREVGWSEEKLYRFERGDQVPDALELAAIASATSQPIGFFFGGETSREGEPVLTDHGDPVKA